MKKRNLILFFVVLYLSIGSSSGLRAADEVKAVPVTGGLYLMEGLNGGNVAFLVTNEGVLVVDSGTTPEEGKLIVAEIAKKTDQPVKYLVLTHYHGDHTFGLQSYPASVVIISQQNTADNMRKLNEPRLRGMMEKGMPEMIAAQKITLDKLRKKKGKDLKKEEERLNELETGLAQLKGLRFVYPAITYDSKLRIALGGETIEVIYPGPAHTNGDSLVFFPGLKVLCTGDMFFNGLLPYIGAEAGADTANWITKVREVSGWDIEKFIPGHGPLADKEALLRLAAYLGDLRQAVKDAIAAGQTLEQAKKMAPLPAWKDLKWQEMFPRNVEAVYNELSRK
jgi:glyoxylase-like metal-dependent hydrolase (beta-lactamase superfamily II)